jgi:hypothetical protein
VDKIAGRQGELIDHLIDLVNSEALGERGWETVTPFIVYFVGGKVLYDVMPDTGRDPAPGTVGERQRQLRRLVSREEYFELLRGRLCQLVVYGIDESFLVRSIRDGLRQELESLADVGTGDRNRAETRGFMERMSEDPAQIAAFRAQLSPEDQTLSDDEISARLREMARSKLFLPTSADDALDRWGLLSRWDEQMGALLPDAAFDEWRMRRLHSLS